jgi:hypothetical protein
MHARIAGRRARRVAALVMLLGTLLASGAHAGTPLPPQGKRALLAWLKAGTYASSFTPEPEVHASTSAHGPYVRTWYSAVLTEDLRAGRVPFRRGAAMVKELYLDGPTAPPVGYSVMRKLRSRSGPTGQGWLFYETFDGRNDAVSFGRGLAVCTGCHRSGVDFLRSAFRP